MTRDEHLAILAFIKSAIGGAQPAMDVEADAIIRASFKRHPEAAYRVTLLAMRLAAAQPPPPPPRTPRPQGPQWLRWLFMRPSAN